MSGANSVQSRRRFSCGADAPDSFRPALTPSLLRLRRDAVLVPTSRDAKMVPAPIDGGVCLSRRNLSALDHSRRHLASKGSTFVHGGAEAPDDPPFSVLETCHNFGESAF